MSEEVGSLENQQNFEGGKERLNLGLQDTCITSSIYFPKYGIEESDTLRGKLAIENVGKVIEAGCKYSLVFNTGTPEEFINDLKKKIVETVSNKEDGLAESDISNVFALTERTGLEYSPTRQQAFEVGRNKFGSRVLVTQEAEKDLVSTYTPFLEAINAGYHIALFDRGIAEANNRPDPKHAGLPEDQYIYERSQDLEMDRVEEAAGLLSPKQQPFDRLIGFRMILNQEVDTKYGVKVNPADLFAKLNLKYIDSFDQKIWGKFTTDFYSQAVYHGIPIAESLGLKIASVSVNYLHDPEQTKIEMGEEREKWKAKRVAHRKTIPPQHFDMVANILEYQKQGIWPQVLFDSLKDGSPLGMKHFDHGKYTIKNGEVIIRPKVASWITNPESKQ